jgi:hypothetical protein
MSLFEQEEEETEFVEDDPQYMQTVKDLMQAGMSTNEGGLPAPPVPNRTPARVLQGAIPSRRTGQRAIEQARSNRPEVLSSSSMSAANERQTDRRAGAGLFETNPQEMSFSLDEAEGEMVFSPEEVREGNIAAKRAFDDQYEPPPADPEAQRSRDALREDKYLSAVEGFMSSSPSVGRYREAMEGGTASPEELDRLYQQQQRDQERFEQTLMRRGTSLPGGGTPEEMLQRIRSAVAPHRGQQAQEEVAPEVTAPAAAPAAQSSQPPSEQQMRVANRPMTDFASPVPALRGAGGESRAAELGIPPGEPPTPPVATPISATVTEEDAEGLDSPSGRVYKPDLLPSEVDNSEPKMSDAERLAEEERVRSRRYRIAQAIRGLGAIAGGIVGAPTNMSENIIAASNQRQTDIARRASSLAQAAQRAQQREQAKESARVRNRQLELAEAREGRDAAEFEQEQATAQRRAQTATPEQREQYIASLPADVRERMRPAIMAPEFTVGQGEDLLEQLLRDTKYSRGSGAGRGAGSGLGTRRGNQDGSTAENANYDTSEDAVASWSPFRRSEYLRLGTEDKMAFANGMRPEGWYGPGSPRIEGRPRTRRTDQNARAELTRIDRELQRTQGGNAMTRRVHNYLSRQGAVAPINAIGDDSRATVFIWNGAQAPTNAQRAGVTTAINHSANLSRARTNYRNNSAEIARLRPANIADAQIAELISRGGTSEAVGSWLTERGFGDENTRDLALAIGQERNLRQEIVGAIRAAENWGAQTLGEQELAESQLPSTPSWNPQAVDAQVANGQSIGAQLVDSRASGISAALGNLIRQHTNRVNNVYRVEGGPDQRMTGRRLQSYIRELLLRRDQGDAEAANLLETIRIVPAPLERR